MPYSVCCGAYSDMAREIDICPICKEHTDWEDEDGEELVPADVVQPKNELKCATCSFLGGNVEQAVDYCNHPSFGYIVPMIEDLSTTLENCPLKKTT